MCYLYRIDDSHARKTIRVPEKLRRETARGGSPLVRVTGLEPAHLTASEPKSDVSANFTTPAYSILTAELNCRQGAVL